MIGLLARRPFLVRMLALGERIPRDALLHFQERQLRRVVLHAYRNVPYYRARLDAAGVRPESVRGLADLERLPVTMKRDLQGLPADRALAGGAGGAALVIRTTSGSSGSPFTVRRTGDEERLLTLLQLRPMHWLGLRARDRMLTIGRRRGGERQTPDPLFALLHRLGMYPQVRLDCLDSPERLARLMHDARPDVVSGFPGVLMRVAEAIESHPGLAVRPRLVISGGEVLTDAMRDRVARVFAAPVRQTYAAHEFRLLAWQCRESGLYHTWDASTIVEVLCDGRPARPGEEGVLVGTALHLAAMPFVRYRLDDVVVRGPERCPCGAPFGTLEAIRGRRIDYFILPEGRLLHPYAITPLFNERSVLPVRRYQLVQERVDAVTLRLVPLGSPDPERLELLLAGVREELGPDVELSLELHEDLPLEPTGKFRYFLSRVSSPYDGDDMTVGPGHARAAGSAAQTGG